MHEEDLRFCGNFLMGCGFVFALFGVIVAGYFEELKCWILCTSILIGIGFAAAGGMLHWIVRQDIKRKTIRRWEDVERGKVQALRGGPGADRGDGEDS